MRVCTIPITLSDSLSDFYANIDADCLVAFVARMTSRILADDHKPVKDICFGLTKKAEKMVKAASEVAHSAPGTLPPFFQAFPLYTRIRSCMMIDMEI